MDRRVKKALVIRALMTVVGQVEPTQGRAGQN
jgi:hypothetical protein